MAAPILYHESRSLKVTISSALIFFLQKIIEGLTSLFLPLFAFETAWSWHNILYFVSLAAKWNFRHVKLTAGGEVWARILAIDIVCFFSFFLFLSFISFLLLAFFHDQMHTFKQEEMRKGWEETYRRAVRFTRFVDYRLMFDLGRSFTLEYYLIRSPY